MTEHGYDLLLAASGFRERRAGRVPQTVEVKMRQARGIEHCAEVLVALRLSASSTEYAAQMAPPRNLRDFAAPTVFRPISLPRYTDDLPPPATLREPVIWQTPPLPPSLPEVPDPLSACKLWLCNRRPEECREKVELGGKDGGPIVVTFDPLERARRLALIFTEAAAVETGGSK